jgi:hypothetical protein
LYFGHLNLNSLKGGIFLHVPFSHRPGRLLPWGNVS